MITEIPRSVHVTLHEFRESISEPLPAFRAFVVQVRVNPQTRDVFELLEPRSAKVELNSAVADALF